MTKLRHFINENDTLKSVEYTWEEVYLNQEKMKKDFREKNCTDEILARGISDRLYDDYCQQIEKFLDSVPIDQIKFEYRINEAKRRREKGLSPWDNTTKQ